MKNDILSIAFSAEVLTRARLVFCMLLLLVGVGTSVVSAQEMVGTPGAADRRGVANFSELAREDSLAPSFRKRAFTKPYQSLRGPRLAAPETIAPTAETSSAVLAESRSPDNAGGPMAVTASPPPSASFVALLDNDTVAPPDTSGAVGPNHLMTTLASQVRIQNRAGGEISTVSLESFWAGLGASNVVDPRVLYDPLGQRWIFTAAADPAGANPGLLIAVTRTNDPTGLWNRYFVDVDTASPIYADSPTVGFNKNRIIVQANMYNKTNFNFVRSQIYAFNKTNLYAGGVGLKTTIQVDPNFGYSQVPAVTYDPDLATNYLVMNWFGDSDGVGYLRIFSVVGALGAETLTAGPFVADLISPLAWADYNAPNDADLAPQLGSTNKVYMGDSRIQSVVFRNSTLWLSQTIFLPAAAPTRAAVQWWEVTPGGQQPIQRGLVDDPSGATSYGYPSLAVNANNDVLVGYSRFSASHYPSAYYSFRVDTDQFGTLQTETLLKAGEAPYSFKIYGQNRWGDWSAATVDPVNDSDLWTIQEFASSQVGGTDRWGTWWGRVSPPQDMAVTASGSPASLPAGANVTYTIVVSNATSGRFTIASGVKLIDTLPPGTAYVSASATKGSCTHSGGIVTCEIGAMDIREKATITIVATTAMPGTITNIANVIANGQETNPGNNTALTTTTVTPSADLVVTITDAPDPVTVTSNLTYSLVVSNRGPSTATSVVLTNTPPAGVTVVSATSSQGTVAQNGNVRIFTLGSILNGATATATVVVTPSSSGTITAQAVVTTSATDPNPANNSASAATTVNARPTISAIANRAVLEDAVTGAIAFTVGDAETAAASLTLAAVSSNPEVVPNEGVIFGGSGASRTVTITPAPNQFGSATITLTVTDGGGATASANFVLTVHGVNDLPTLDAVGNVAMDEDSGSRVVALSGITSGAANEAQTLTVTAVSSQPAIIPHPAVTYASPNGAGSLSFAPLTNASGSATITVTVNDNGGSNNIVTRAFTVTVNPVNDLPTISSIAAQATVEDTATGAASFQVGDLETAAGSLTLTGSSSDPAVVADAGITFGGSGANRTVTVTPVAHQFGTVTITVTVRDDSNGASSSSFALTIHPVNDPPALSTIANVTVNEDAPQQTVNLAGISSGVANESDTLTVTAASGNPSLIPSPTVTYTSPNSAGTLAFTPVANGSGSATITVTVNDGKPTNNITTQMFVVTVQEVNDPPTLDALAPVTVSEDAGPQTVGLTGLGTGAPGEVQTLTVTASSSNPGLIPTPAITYISPNATGTLQFAAVTNASGSATITVTVSDGQAVNPTTLRSFLVTVNPVNDPPTVSAIGARATSEDLPTSAIAFTVDDLETAAGSLTVSGTSSNPGLVPNANIAFGGSGANRTVTLTPAANESGNVTITITVMDGEGLTAVTTCSLTVHAVNDPPTLNAIGNVTVLEDSGLRVVSLAGLTSGAANESQTLSLTASSDNPGLIPTPTILYTSPAATGELRFTPTTNGNGSATITVTVNDQGSSNNVFSRTFTVTVNPVNDTPTISAVVDAATDEDTATVIPFTIGDIETPAGSLILAGSSSNEEVISGEGISFGGSGANRTVTIRPLTNQFGDATITITVSDPEGDAVEASFVLTVLPVNDAPILSPIAGLSINEDSATAAIPFTVEDPESPVNEITVSANSSNPGLVPNGSLVLGGSGGNRTITITPLPNQFGSATLQIMADDGERVTTNSFGLTVVPVNDPPTLNPPADVTMDEDAAPLTVVLAGLSAGAPNENNTLTVTATSSAPSIVGHPAVSYSSPNSGGTLTLAPVANASGVVTITVTVNDGQGANNLFSRTFMVTVNPVNDAPTISIIADQATNEDTPTAAIPFTIGDVDTPLANLAVAISSSNTNLISASGLVLGGSGANRTLILSPATNQAGTAAITITVNDGSGGLTQRSFNLVVNEVNDLPVISALGNVAISEDTTSPLIAFTVGDVETAATDLTVTAVSSNPSLVPPAGFAFSGAGANRSLTITPAANQFGTALITVTVNDSDGGARSSAFNLAVASVEDAPTISPVPDQATDEDTVLEISFTVADVDSPTLTVSAGSSNGAVVPAANIALGGTGNNRTATITPAANQSGTTTILLTVTDGTQTANRSFVLTVNSVNDLPVVASIADQTTDEDTPTSAIGFTIGDVETAANSLVLAGVSSNPALVPMSNIAFGGSGSNRTVRVTPAADQFGTATITVTASDAAGGARSQSFLLTVRAVNDAPTLDALVNLSLNQGAGLQTVNLTGIGSGAANEAENLTVSASSSNPALIPTPTVSYTSPSLTGTLSFTAQPGASGTATITVTVNDGQAQNTTLARSFTVTVNARPTISAVGDVSVNEDTTAGPVAFTVGDVETAAGSLTVVATSSDPALVPDANVVLGGSGASRTVTVTPLAEQAGAATITLTVSDAGGASASTSFVLTVVGVNDPPTLDPIGDWVLDEDAGPRVVALTGIGSGASNESQALAVTATSSHPSIIGHPAISYASPGASGTLTFTPVANASGVVTITVVVDDGQSTNRLGSRTFSVTVNPVNDLPTISAVGDVSVNEDTTAGPVAFTVGDVETAAGSLTVVATSSDPALVPNANVVLGGSGASRTVTITPLAEQAGAATITLTVSDAGGASASTSFVLTVVGVNDPPTLDPIGDWVLDEDAGPRVVALTGIGSGASNESQALAVTATSSHPSIIGHPAISYASPGTGGTLTFTPVANASGVVTITVVVDDGQSTNRLGSRTFSVTVNPVNDLPTISAVGDVSVNEDTTAGPVAFTVGDVETAAGSLTVVATSSDPALVPNANVVLGGSGASRTVTVTPLAEQAGAATITVVVTDAQGASSSDSFVVTVNPVNDAPTLDVLDDLALGANAGAQTVTLGGLGVGAANEIQTLTITAVSGNTAVIPHPTVNYTNPSATGSLVFTPVVSAAGSAVITVTVRDDGGIANGGENSLTRTFTVTVTAGTAPTLRIAMSGADILLAWPVAAEGFRLEAKTALPLGGDWTAITATPVVVGSEYTVTRPAMGESMYYRLTSSPIPPVIEPRLRVTLSAEGVVVSWPVTEPPFTLQSNSNLLNPDDWTTVSTPPVVVGDEYSVTLPPSGSARYFRLTSGTTPSPDGPKLEITIDDGALSITWPDPEDEFVLESSSDLLDPENWAEVATQPETIDGTKAVTLELSGSGPFFRLRRK